MTGGFFWASGVARVQYSARSTIRLRIFRSSVQRSEIDNRFEILKGATRVNTIRKYK